MLDYTRVLSNIISVLALNMLLILISLMLVFYYFVTLVTQIIMSPIFKISLWYLLFYVFFQED